MSTVLTDLSLRASDVPPLVSALLLLAGQVLLAESVRRVANAGAEFTRKFLHIGTGLLIACAPQWIERAAPVVMICLFFIALNTMAIRAGWLAGVHGTHRRSYGTVCYPLALLFLSLLFWERAPNFAVVPMLVLALGDGFAGMTGELLLRPHRYRITADRKSIEGSAVMFLVTCVVLLVSVGGLSHHSASLTPVEISVPILGMILAIAAFVTAWESVGSGGLENLFVPLAAAFGLYLCFASPAGDGGLQFAAGAALGAAIAFASFRFHALSRSGAVGTFLLATVIFGTGGWTWTLPILAFFLLSSLLSMTGGGRQTELASVLEKHHARDLTQVFANGGIAGLLAIAGVLEPGGIWFPLFLGTLAAVTADTWSTEIGTRFGSHPVSILTGKRVAAGMSGGVTLPGSAGGVLGAAVIAAVGLAVLQPGERSAGLFLCVLASGVFGGVVDSVLGASIQGRYRCVICDADNERRKHCGQDSLHVKGFRWMNNDTVNVVCAAAGLLAMWILTEAMDSDLFRVPRAMYVSGTMNWLYAVCGF